MKPPLPPSNHCDPERWLELYGDILYRYALFQVKNEAAAEDLVQETLLAALKGYANFAKKSSVQTWLIGILKHKMVDYFRQHDEISLEELTNDDEMNLDDFFTANGKWISAPSRWNDPEDSLEQQHFWLVLRRCIGLLPPKLAYIFNQKEINHLENEKICKELEITETNLWVMLFRARLQLRQCLEHNWF